jgi:hypothetical protein
MNKHALIIDIKTPIIGKIMTLDTLLAYVVAQRLDGDFSKAYNQLPLKQTNGLYHASTGIIHQPEPFSTTYIAGLHAGHYLDADIVEINSRTGKHPRLSEKRKREFGNVMHKYYGTFGKSIWFFFEGDGDEVINLMMEMPFIGKKSTTGWGELNLDSIEIETATVNGVLDVDGYPLRPIPDFLYKGVKNNDVIIADTCWKGPSWAFENREKCYIKSKEYGYNQLENMLTA